MLIFVIVFAAVVYFLLALLVGAAVEDVTEWKPDTVVACGLFWPFFVVGLFFMELFVVGRALKNYVKSACSSFIKRWRERDE